MTDVGRSLTSSTKALKLALVGLLATMVIHIVGFSTNYWTMVAIGREEFKQGLWQICGCLTEYPETCICSEIPMGTEEDPSERQTATEKWENARNERLDNVRKKGVIKKSPKRKHPHRNIMASNRKWVELDNGPIRVSVIKGDLTTEKADVIICAASKNLDLGKGRMSRSVLEAAGQQIQKDCKSKYPNGIQNDEVAVVSSGRLPCKKIYFISLPVYGSKGTEKDTLRSILTKCLATAHIAKYTSLAMPALGTGFLKYPAGVVAETTLKCLEEFNDNNQATKLRDVSVIVYYKDIESYQAFVDEIKVKAPVTFDSSDDSEDSELNHDNDDNSGTVNDTDEMSMPEYMLGANTRVTTEDSDDDPDTQEGIRQSWRQQLREEYRKQARKCKANIFVDDRCPKEEEIDNFGLESIVQAVPTVTANSIGNISVHIVLGKLADFHADVIVSTTTGNLKLDNGALAESLLRKAGSQLQEECYKSYPNGIKAGDVAVTGGYNLKASKVYHGALTRWEKGYSAKKSLSKFVCNCLEQAASDRFSHIAFPALGTGALKFPLDVTASVMIKCVTLHESNFHDSTLTDVSIVVFDGDKNCSKVKAAFEQALADARTKSGRADSSPRSDYESPDIAHPRPSLGFKVPNSRPARKVHTPFKLQAQIKRGSTEWFKEQYKSEPRTPSYWTVFHSKKTLKDWHIDSEDIKPCAVPVDLATFQAVEKVVKDSWKSQFVGHGRDAQGLGGYSRINLTSVERIENSEIFEKYFQKRQELFHKAVKVGTFKRLEDVKDSTSSVLTESTLSDVLMKDLYPEINEHYLFHGTRDVKTIINQGLDTRLAGSGAMFGPGIYFAESSTKADQYADTKSTRSNDKKKMFLVRVCLGEMYVQQQAHVFKRPPCRHCQEDKCSCESNDFYHAVIGDGSWNFREFIVYDRQQVYPEYVITYERV